MGDVRARRSPEGGESESDSPGAASLQAWGDDELVGRRDGKWGVDAG